MHSFITPHLSAPFCFYLTLRSKLKPLRDGVPARDSILSAYFMLIAVILSCSPFINSPAPIHLPRVSSDVVLSPCETPLASVLRVSSSVHNPFIWGYERRSWTPDHSIMPVLKSIEGIRAGNVTGRLNYLCIPSRVAISLIWCGVSGLARQSCFAVFWDFVNCYVTHKMCLSLYLLHTSYKNAHGCSCWTRGVWVNKMSSADVLSIQGIGTLLKGTTAVL